METTTYYRYSIEKSVNELSDSQLKSGNSQLEIPHEPCDRLVLQTTNLDGLDNRPQVSTACGRLQFSIAQIKPPKTCLKLR